MGDDRIDGLARSHEEALERIAAQEAQARRSRWALVASVIGALGAGGGGGAAAYLGNDDDSIKTVVAEHIAAEREWRREVDADRARLEALRDAVIRLQATVEAMGIGSRELRTRLDEARRLLEEAGAAGGRAGHPGPESVMKIRGELFKE